MSRTGCRPGDQPGGTADALLLPQSARSKIRVFLRLGSLYILATGCTTPSSTPQNCTFMKLQLLLALLYDIYKNTDGCFC